jgi:iron complex transport system substrate-binding protein
MQRLAAIVLMLGLGGIFPAKAHAERPKAASFGLCADQMLMMLADPRQIASLSAQATGPLSAYASKAKAYPTNRGSAEEVIASGAKLLLQSDAVSQQSAAALRSFGVKVVQIPLANSWAEVDAVVRDIARELGQVARGEALIANMHQRLAAIRPPEPISHWPRIIYYRPDGGGAGSGTFVDISLNAAGFRNVQAEWGPPLWSGIPAERVVRQPPDAFAVSYFDTSNNGSSVLRRNPVLWGQARSRPVIIVAGKYWNCGSPLLVDAVELLAKERQKLMHSSAMVARRAATKGAAR